MKVSNELAKLIKSLKSNPKYLRKLNPGASKRSLESLKKMGAPKQLLEMYKAFDGCIDRDDIFFGSWHSVKDVIYNRNKMKKIAKEEKWAKDFWDENWIPLFGEDGVIFALDMVGGAFGPPGQIIQFVEETGPRLFLTSLEDLFELVNTLIEKNLLFYKDYFLDRMAPIKAQMAPFQEQLDALTDEMEDEEDRILDAIEREFKKAKIKSKKKLSSKKNNRKKD